MGLAFLRKGICKRCSTISAHLNHIQIVQDDSRRLCKIVNPHKVDCRIDTPLTSCYIHRHDCISHYL